MATADINGRTYTVDPGNPWVKAVLVDELFTALRSAGIHDSPIHLRP